MGGTNTHLLNALVKKVGSSTCEKKENEVCIPTQGNQSMKVPWTAGVCMRDVENQTLSRSSPLDDFVLPLVTSACRRHVPQGSVPQGRGRGGAAFPGSGSELPWQPSACPQLSHVADLRNSPPLAVLPGGSSSHNSSHVSQAVK